jgi:hypothetical protein
MKHTFKRDFDGGIIVVPTKFNNLAYLNFMLDTAASCTTIDRNAVLMHGFDLGNPITTNRVETSKGMLDIDVYPFESLSAFGLTRHNVKLQVYDFLEQGIVSNYQGVLGLDFFEGTQFTINMVKNTIAVKILQ